MRVVTANVNGLRAAVRRGGLDRLAALEADVIALQEVRASEAEAVAALAAASAGFDTWHFAHAPAAAKGRAGVAILTREAPEEVRVGLGAEFRDQGRWIETDLLVGGRPVTVVSTYVHTGEAGTGRQEEKERFLALVGERLAGWCAEGRYAVLTGDLNVAHHEHDLKNWRGNLARAGFLPSERAYLDSWFADHGMVDVHRHLHGPGPGPYTWWSWRGKAFDNDAGWRIDYQLATPGLAAYARHAFVGRAPSYAERWSDHAPVIVDYDLSGA